MSFVHRMPLLALFVCIAASCSACLYYDSRWAQQQEERKHAVERLKPAHLQRRASSAVESRVAYVKAYATRAYVTETLRWEERFEELLQGANAVLEPAMGLSLENGGTFLWHAASEDRLEEVEHELAASDPGNDVGWVVAFVKSTPKLEFDYHQLGVGAILSKHLVVRASNDPRELEMLSEECYKLSDSEKAKLHSDRKRHRMIAVFLHEIGHTLGAQHRSENADIMNPIYNDRSSGFDETALGLFRITLPNHLDNVLPRDTYPAVVDFYKAHPDGWVGSERDNLIAFLAATSSPRQRSSAQPSGAAVPTVTVTDEKPPPQTSAAPPASALGLETLSAADRQRYDQAVEAEARGELRIAWKLIIPVVETNARVVEVQDLRCRLAQKQHFIDMIVEAHCAPLAKLRAQQNTGR